MTDQLFLTDEQLVDLTSYVMPSAQVRWLVRNGVHHYVRGDGKPRVLASTIQPDAAPRKAAWTPNFDAVRARR